MKKPSPPKPHMWTASWQAFSASNELVGCGHMSGLSTRRIWPLALMKSDNQELYQRCELLALVAYRSLPDLGHDRVVHRVFYACQTFNLDPFDDILYRSGLRERLRSEGFACLHHGPYDSRELVRKRHGHEATRSSGAELNDPLGQPSRARARAIQQRTRRQDQQFAYVAITFFANGPERRLAAAGVLSRRQSEPGCKVSPKFEYIRIWRSCNNRRSDELPNTWNAIDQLSDLALLMGVSYSQLQ